MGVCRDGGAVVMTGSARMLECVVFGPTLRLPTNATHLEVGGAEAGQSVPLGQRPQLPQPLGRGCRETDLALCVCMRGGIRACCVCVRGREGRVGGQVYRTHNRTAATPFPPFTHARRIDGTTYRQVGDDGDVLRARDLVGAVRAPQLLHEVGGVKGDLQGDVHTAPLVPRALVRVEGDARGACV